MEQLAFLYAPPGRGYNQPQHNQPVYYQPAYYPYPYYYGTPVNPYEAARQGESADRIASIIWKLVAVIVICVVVGVVGFALFLAAA